MPKKKGSNELAVPAMRPAMSSEGREQHLINLAMERAEQQLVDGTASSQVITHFLKLGTVQSQLELEKMRAENLLIEAKIRNLDAQATSQELYQEAIAAMARYSGNNINN